ncbi:hypothetical protein FLWE109334_15100 [Flavobacterium weaverense]
MVNPTIGSVTTTLVREVFPVFVTAKVYVITSPSLPVPLTTAVFTSAILGVCVSGVSVGVLLSTEVPDTSVTLFPFGSFAVAKAVLTTLPASISN